MTSDRIAMLKDWHAGNTGCIPARPNPTEPEPLYPVTDGARAFMQDDNFTEPHEESDDDNPVVLRDSIGTGVGVHLFRDRGIVSVVLVDDENGIPLANTPSAEIMLSDLAQALEMLQKGEGGEAGKEDWQA